MSTSTNWELYYQAKFKLFLLKHKIVLNNDKKEVVVIEGDKQCIEIKWLKNGNADAYKD